MATKAPVTEAHVRRVLAEVLAGQETACAEMSPEGIELLARQLRGEVTADQAVAEVIARAEARFGRSL